MYRLAVKPKHVCMQYAFKNVGSKSFTENHSSVFVYTNVCFCFFHSVVVSSHKIYSLRRLGD